MKRIISTTLALALAAFLGQPAVAKDKKDKDREEESAEAKKKSAARPGTKAIPPGLARKNVASQASRSVAVDRSRSQSSGTARVESQQFDRSRDSQRVDVVRRSNNDRHDNDRHDSDRNNDHGWSRYRYYNAPSTAYRGWNRGRTYTWNSHRYHWYGDSWVLIDPGYAYAEYSNAAPVISRNVVADVQDALARRGYRPGPVDGAMGGQTRNAIAQFQGDHGLRVTARIDNSLLSALDLG